MRLFAYLHGLIGTANAPSKKNGLNEATEWWTQWNPERFQGQVAEKDSSQKQEKSWVRLW